MHAFLPTPTPITALSGSKKTFLACDMLKDRMSDTLTQAIDELSRPILSPESVNNDTHTLKMLSPATQVPSSSMSAIPLSIFPPSPNKSPWHNPIIPDRGNGNSVRNENHNSAIDDLDEPSRLTFIPVTMSLNHYERLNQVGEGTYGKVYKARDRRNSSLVALKKVRIEPDKDGFPITGIREIKILTTLRHPNIVKLKEIVSSKDRIDLVFEYMDHDLTGLFANSQFKPSPSHIKCLMRQMFEGLSFLHNKRVMHRDLKGSNLLIDRSGNMKIADFGLARYLTRVLPQKGHLREMDYTNRVITLWYRPPELLMGATKYGPEVDMWSAGVIFLEFFLRKTVFPGDTEITQLESIIKLCGSPDNRSWPECQQLPWYDMMLKGKPHHSTRLHQYKDVTTKATFDLIQSLLQLNPKKRLTAEEALSHAYFQEEPLACHPRELEAILPTEDWHEWESKKRKEALREERGRRAAAATTSSILDQSAPDEPEPPPASKSEGSLKADNSLPSRAAVITMENGKPTSITTTASQAASTKAAEAFRERMAARLGITNNSNSSNANATNVTSTSGSVVQVDGNCVATSAGKKKASGDPVRPASDAANVGGSKKEIPKNLKKSVGKSKASAEKSRGDGKTLGTSDDLADNSQMGRSKARTSQLLSNSSNNSKLTLKFGKSSRPSTPTDAPHDTPAPINSNADANQPKSVKIKSARKPTSGYDIHENNVFDDPEGGDVGIVSGTTDGTKAILYQIGELKPKKRRRRSRKDVSDDEEEKVNDDDDGCHDGDEIAAATPKKAKIISNNKRRSTNTSSHDKKSASNIGSSSKVAKDHDSSTTRTKKRRRRVKDTYLPPPFPPEHSGLTSTELMAMMDLDPPPYQASPLEEVLTDGELEAAAALEAIRQPGNKLMPFERGNAVIAKLVGSDHLSSVAT
ncbi:hypothetical protein SeMB42_g05404 [Synchytrium endobioticum]|uniref:Protein kinase domain-containing protein n=1 Tax=Synchytrium endobioticum TaxID=286115 RepID=A0A507CRM9_9FUNG|nr:hypothetical protein SeMB42_g05404 [Synchytrium endobioticum]TPX44948.1 hypothetical protein SeLEV6574_g04186 [Synchytrium endobioticum]